MRWVTPIAIGLALLAAAVPRAHDAGIRLAAQADKAKAYDDEFEKARQLLQRHEYFQALKGFQKANQLAGGHSAECFVAMAQAMLGMKVYQNVIETAQTAIELAQNDPLLRARGHTARGTAFQALAEKDHPSCATPSASSGRRSRPIPIPELPICTSTSASCS